MNNIVRSSETAALVSVIERAARDPMVDVPKLRELLNLRCDIENREAERQFRIALAAVQAEMEPVRRDASNPQTKSKYATYVALDRAVRPIYTAHGFALSFNTVPAPGDGLMVTCAVSRDGYVSHYQLPMPADGRGAKGGEVMTRTHATGAAITYGRRYLLAMIFNIATSDSDDDGNAASLEPISAEQAAELQRLLDEAGSDPGRYLRYVGASTIAEIPAAKYQFAKQALENAIKRNKAAAEAETGER
jgi:hypothetical protein